MPHKPPRTRLRAPLPPDGPVDLITGKQLPRLTGFPHDPIRKGADDPKKAARKVAKEAVARFRAERKAAG